MRLPVRTGRERTTRVAVVPVPLTRGLGTRDGHAWGRSGTSGRHRLAHGNPKRRIFSAGTKLRSMSPVPWPPRVLTGATLWRRPYQSLSRMRCDAGSIATSKTCGYIVFETGDPLEALTIGEQRNGAIDLLLTDMVMPGMRGSELAERLAATNPKLRVLRMSGYAEEMIAAAANEPARLFLPKPFTPHDLAKTVRQPWRAANGAPEGPGRHRPISPHPVGPPNTSVALPLRRSSPASCRASRRRRKCPSSPAGDDSN
jgi:CheY-like chemotaxis protein